VSFAQITCWCCLKSTVVIAFAAQAIFFFSNNVQIFLLSGVVAGRKGQKSNKLTTLDFWRSEKCWKIFLSENFRPTTKKCGLKTSFEKIKRQNIGILSTQQPPVSEIVSVWLSVRKLQLPYPTI